METTHLLDKMHSMLRCGKSTQATHMCVYTFVHGSKSLTVFNQSKIDVAFGGIFRNTHIIRHNSHNMTDTH